MSKNILTFSVPELKDRISVCETLFHVEQSDLAFPNLYLLRHKYGTELAFYKNWLFRRYTGNGRLKGYTFPVGENIDYDEALFHVEHHARAHGTPLLYCLLTESQADFLKQKYGDKVSFEKDPGDADYLYQRKDLAELNGTAFHKKRNQISRFERSIGRWTFRAIDDDNVVHAVQIARCWLDDQEPAAQHEHELRAIEKALDLRHKLGIFGGLLYVEREPVALSLASYINSSVVDIHYEKCLPAYRDAYALINREMARFTNGELINREEDLNVPGLRRAKLSYKPVRILEKLSAVVDLC